jgi:hypothetical protein
VALSVITYTKKSCTMVLEVLQINHLSGGESVTVTTSTVQTF